MDFDTQCCSTNQRKQRKPAKQPTPNSHRNLPKCPTNVESPPHATSLGSRSGTKVETINRVSELLEKLRHTTESSMQLIFNSATKLIMDVTIGHTHNRTHGYGFNPNAERVIEYSKRYKYDSHCLRQRLASAPMVANTLCECGPDLLNFSGA